MIITTTNQIEGHKIIAYKGIVSGQVAIGTGIFSSLNASLADILGVDANMYSDKLNSGKSLAILQMESKAKNLNANAIIGVDIDYTTFTGDIIGVVATGTAVVINKVEELDLNYVTQTVNVKNKVMDGNIDILNVILSYADSSNEQFVSIRGINKSGKNIEGLLVRIDFLSPFGSVICSEKIEFFDITKNGNIFATNFKKIYIDNFKETKVDLADVSLINLIADGRKLYSGK